MGTGVSPKRIDTENFIVSFRTFLCPIQAFTTLRFVHAFYRPMCLRIFVRSQASLYELICSFTSPQYLNSISNPYFFLRKEVIQPHLPIRLPCYDFTPVIEPAFDDSFLTVRSSASGIPNSHGVTGGVYKTRERIHRDILIRDY